MWALWQDTNALLCLCICLALLLSPILWTVCRVLHHYREQQPTASCYGYCTNCGYDLRATPRRCPECGQIVPKIQRPVRYWLHKGWILRRR